MNTTDKDTIFKIVQNFLSTPPLIIWGSGATIPFGLPSMNDLNNALRKKIPDFNKDNNSNLEEELGKIEYQNEMKNIKKIIWETINEKDKVVLENIISNKTEKFSGIKSMFEQFIDSHPQTINIVTTNYDKVLEYVAAFYQFPFTNGFNGKILSKFDINIFKKEKIINIIKVHGSLDWLEFNTETRLYPFHISADDYSYKIIPPSKSKYEEGYEEPYRELIQKSDKLIESANSYLAVGFGFNDKHLTPRVRTMVNQGKPIVIITRTITKSTHNELANAEKYIFFEEENGKTKVTYKENKNCDIISTTLSEDYWQLTKFMEIL